MKRFYCYGKKGCCDKCKDNQCYTCEFHNGEGGKEVDAPTNYERIRNMDIKKMALFLQKHIPPDRVPSEVEKIWIVNQTTLFDAWVKWLESEVDQ